MSRERDKRTRRRYFDLEVLCDISEEGSIFRSFVDRYGTYVFKRADGFNARFQVKTKALKKKRSGPVLCIYKYGHLSTDTLTSVNTYCVFKVN